MRFHISDPNDLLCDALRSTIDESTERGRYVSCCKLHPSDLHFVVEGLTEAELRSHLITLKETLRRFSSSLKVLPSRAKKKV